MDGEESSIFNFQEVACFAAWKVNTHSMYIFWPFLSNQCTCDLKTLVDSAPRDESGVATH